MEWCTGCPSWVGILWPCSWHGGSNRYQKRKTFQYGIYWLMVGYWHCSTVHRNSAEWPVISTAFYCVCVKTNACLSLSPPTGRSVLRCFAFSLLIYDIGTKLLLSSAIVCLLVFCFTKTTL